MCWRGSLAVQDRQDSRSWSRARNGKLPREARLHPEPGRRRRDRLHAERLAKARFREDQRPRRGRAARIDRWRGVLAELRVSRGGEGEHDVRQEHHEYLTNHVVLLTAPPVAVAGQPPARLLAATTRRFPRCFRRRESLAWLPGWSRADTTTSSVVSPSSLRRTSFVLPTNVLRASQTCGRGLLGADVLAHCTLIWGSSSL